MAVCSELAGPPCYEGLTASLGPHHSLSCPELCSPRVEMFASDPDWNVSAELSTACVHMQGRTSFGGAVCSVG